MKKRKKYLVFWFISLLILSVFIINISYSEEEWCSYQWKINECLAANLDWSYRAIEEFVCIKSDNVKENVEEGVLYDEKIAYQIILDEKFTKIDDKIEEYLDWLEKNKSKYFWKNAQKSYIEWVDDIERKLAIQWEFREMFYKECSVKSNDGSWDWWIINDLISCSKYNSISINNARNLLSNNWGDCMGLATVKLYIARQVALNILPLNKYQVRKDEHKLFVKQERTKYDKLIDLINVNLWYMERILKTWPSKTFRAH